MHQDQKKYKKDKYREDKLKLTAGIRAGYIPVIESYLSYPLLNAKVNDQGDTPLTLAIQGGRLPVVKFLLGMGAQYPSISQGPSIPVWWYLRAYQTIDKMILERIQQVSDVFQRLSGPGAKNLRGEISRFVAQTLFLLQHQIRVLHLNDKNRLSITLESLLGIIQKSESERQLLQQIHSFLSMTSHIEPNPFTSIADRIPMGIKKLLFSAVEDDKAKKDNYYQWVNGKIHYLPEILNLAVVFMKRKKVEPISGAIWFGIDYKYHPRKTDLPEVLSPSTLGFFRQIGKSWRELIDYSRDVYELWVLKEENRQEIFMQFEKLAENLFKVVVNRKHDEDKNEQKKNDIIYFKEIFRVMDEFFEKFDRLPSIQREVVVNWRADINEGIAELDGDKTIGELLYPLREIKRVNPFYPIVTLGVVIQNIIIDNIDKLDSFRFKTDEQLEALKKSALAELDSIHSQPPILVNYYQSDVGKRLDSLIQEIALKEVMQKHNYAAINAILDESPELVNTPFLNSEYPIMWILQSCTLPNDIVLDIFLTRGVALDILYKSKSQQQACMIDKVFYVAVQNGHLQTVDKMLQFQPGLINLPFRNDVTYENSPLIVAALNRHHELVNFLLSKRANIDFTNKQGKTALTIIEAQQNPDKDMLLLLKAAACKKSIPVKLSESAGIRLGGSRPQAGGALTFSKLYV